MLESVRHEDYIWTAYNKNRFGYLGNGFSTKESEGRDLSWYFNSPEKGYEGVDY
jgi:hypothetical protein